jgi:energy-coupling factor transport system ATP-binding protein
VQGAVAPTQPGPVVLRADHVSHRFRGAAVPALDGATLDVREGEVLAIVGANGAGKTTLALALAGAIRPTGGTVFLAGRDLRTLDPRELRARVAYVFQYPEHQFIARTARDELLVTLRARGADASSARLRADEALDEAGLAALALADPRSLSHGQKRRLSVATALVGVPQVVILDEPTFGQDRRHTELLAEKMRQLAREGRAAILVTHDMALVADVADRVVALSDGRVAFSGRPEDLFARGEDLAAWGLALPPVAAAFALARQSRADLPFAIGLRSAAAAMDARP